MTIREIDNMRAARNFPFFRAIKVLAATLSLMTGVSSHAAGWTKAALNIGEFGNALVIALIVLCAAGGVGAIGYAGKRLLEKSGEYEPHGNGVEWSHIFYAILAGAFLLSVSFIALTTVETLGGSTDDIGKTINVIAR